MYYCKLPHLSRMDRYQFVTFRTQASVKQYLEIFTDKNLNNAKSQYEMDQYLDNNHVGSFFWLEVVDKAKEIILASNNKEYRIIALSIMPNHIHILLQQFTEISHIVQLMKGRTAYQINKINGIGGKLWQSDYYDRFIRDEKQYVLTYNYIKDNAFKADLKDYKNRFYGIHEFEEEFLNISPKGAHPSG